MAKKKPLRSKFTPEFATVASIPSWANIILFAESGAGKTTALSTVPLPALVVNIDGGIGVLPPQDDILIYPAHGGTVESWDEIEEMVEWAENGGLEELGIKTICFDTWTELAYVHLPAKVLSEPGITGRVREDVMSQSDYGTYGSIHNNLMRRIRELPCHVVLTAQPHDEYEDDPAGGRVMWRMPDLGLGNISGPTFPRHMDAVIYMELKKKKGEEFREYLLKPLNRRKGKLRTKHGTQAPDVLQDARLEDIIDLIVHNKEEDEEDA